jgi:hypothetical protein
MELKTKIHLTPTHVLEEIYDFSWASKNSNCSSPSLLTVKRYWLYNHHFDMLEATLFESIAEIHDEISAKRFSQRQVCGNAHWRVGEVVDCTFDKLPDLEDDLGSIRNYSILKEGSLVKIKWIHWEESKSFKCEATEDKN